jgi:hypothetical protein
MGELSTFLFARPSFAEGVARLVDFSGSLNEYNYSPNGRQADAIALWADWTCVGNELRSAWIDELIEAKRRLEQERNVKKLPKAQAAS